MIQNSTIKSLKHIPPKYIGYVKDSYAEITECKECGAVSLLYDAHSAVPCKYCGGKVVRAGGAKWIPPVTRWSWFKRIVITPGYWLPPLKIQLKQNG